MNTLVMCVSAIVINCSIIIGMDYNEGALIREIGMKADKDKAKKLLEKGIDVNTPGFLGYPMLIHALSYMHETECNTIPIETRLDFVEFLINNGAEVTPRVGGWHKVPMMVAVVSDFGPEFMALLIKHGADVNAMNGYDGGSVLHLAAWNGYLNSVYFILSQKNIHINAVDGVGMTPLIRAAFWGYAKVVEVLLKNDADPSIRDSYGRNALDYARIGIDNSTERLETEKYLLQYTKGYQ